MPLAVVAGMAMLLGSLATQMAMHKSRLRHGAALLQRRVEDHLASAAHHLVARVVAGHPCLLEHGLEQWAAAEGCGDATAHEALRDGVEAPLPYRLTHWQPISAGVAAPATTSSLELELAEPRAAGAEPWRAVFLLDLHHPPGGGPPRVVALRELGLRGVAP